MMLWDFLRLGQKKLGDFCLSELKHWDYSPWPLCKLPSWSEALRFPAVPAGSWRGKGERERGEREKETVANNEIIVSW